MARNLHPKLAFHLPETKCQALRDRLAKGQTLTDLMVMIVDRYLEDDQQPSVQAMKAELAALIDRF